MAVPPVSQHSKGTKLRVKISAAFVDVVGVTTIKPPVPTKAEIDTTDLDSEAHEFILDIPDNGELTVPLNLKKAASGNGFHASQQYLEDSAGTDVLEIFQVYSPRFGKTYEFNAYVKTFDGPDAGVGKQVTASVTLRVSGAVIRTQDDDE